MGQLRRFLFLDGAGAIAHDGRTIHQRNYGGLPADNGGSALQVHHPKPQRHFSVTGVTASAMSQNYGLVSGVLIMPTNLDAVTGARKRKAQALPPTEITVLLVCVIIFLCMLVLLFVDQSFSKAAIELLGRF